MSNRKSKPYPGWAVYVQLFVSIVFAFAVAGFVKGF